jgi:hypothetical protein
MNWRRRQTFDDGTDGKKSNSRIVPEAAGTD